MTQNEGMFEQNGIRLRIIEERDLEQLRRLRNDPSTWINLTHVDLIDAESQKRWFQSLTSQKDRKYYAVEDGNEGFLGMIRTDEIDRNNRSIRVGCDIVPEQRGKGFGSKAFGAIVTYCFDFLNMHRVWLAVLETNSVAQRLYEKHGFKKEGAYRQALFRDGRYYDYIIMSLLEEEFRGQQTNA